MSIKSKTQKLLSVVVPAYKQERTIKKDLASIDKVLADGLGSDFEYEIICVVDGSPDKTELNARKVKSSKIQVISYDFNRGKGYAVRRGMEIAKGEFISFLDAGMEISPKGINMLMAHLDWYNADIIVGSKRHPVSRVNYPPLRHILSIGYHLGIKLLFALPLTDTQSGIKVFKRNVIEKILPRLKIDDYAMDIEMLALAKHLGFKRIYEAPIEVMFDQRSSTIRWHSSFKMAWDTFLVFWRLKVIKFYD